MNREERFILSNLNKILDRIEQIKELSGEVKYSSLDMGCMIESDLDTLETTLRQELKIKEYALLQDWKRDTSIPA